MGVSGHMIIQNGIKYDYPFIEAAKTLLPACEEFVFVEGMSEDATYDRLMDEFRGDSRVRILRRGWEGSDYNILSDATNAAIEECRQDYHVQIQADEGVTADVLREIQAFAQDGQADIVNFPVVHFYGSFETIYRKGVFYDSFWRMAKRSLYPRVRSVSDAMGLQNDLQSFMPGFATEPWHHYGYVRLPEKLIEKHKRMMPLWGWQELDPFLEHGERKGVINWSEKHPPSSLEYFTGSHPEPYHAWIASREEIVRKGIARPSHELERPGTELA